MMDFKGLPEEPKARMAEWRRREKFNQTLRCKQSGCMHLRYGCADYCHAHATERRKVRTEGARKAVATRRANHPEWGKPIHALWYWQQWAHNAVHTAIKRGMLPDLTSGEYACTDCGACAYEYDHRDYGRPLDVQPVCRSCNKRRGTAKWPSADQFNFPKIGKQERAA